MALTHPLCLLRSLRHFLRLFYPAVLRAALSGNPLSLAPVSGHAFVDTEEHHGCTVIVSRCEVCGEVTVSWQKG